MRTTSSILCVVMVAAAAARTAAAAQGISVPNASFEKGTAGPDGWRLVGSGRWLAGEAGRGKRSIAAGGTGGDNSAWLSEALGFEPSAVYSLSFVARSLGASGGTAVSGPGFCNRDLGGTRLTS